MNGADGAGDGEHFDIEQLQNDLSELARTMDDLNAALADLLKAVRQHSFKLMLTLEVLAPAANDPRPALLN